MTSFVTRGRGSVASSNANSTDKDITNGDAKHIGKNNYSNSESGENYEHHELSQINGNTVKDTCESESRAFLTEPVNSVDHDRMTVETQPILTDKNCNDIVTV